MARHRQPPTPVGVDWPLLLALRWSHVCMRSEVLWPAGVRSLPAHGALPLILSFLDEHGRGDDARAWLATQEVEP